MPCAISPSSRGEGENDQGQKAEGGASSAPPLRLRPDKTFLNILSTIADSWSTAYVRPEGTYTNTRIGHRLASALFGAQSALLCIFCARWLPSWVSVVWIVWGFRRIGPLALALRLLGLWRGALLVVVMWGCWIACEVTVVHHRWRMVVHEAVASLGIATAMAWLKYVLSDGPPGLEWVVLMAQLYKAVGFGLAVLVVMMPGRSRFLIDWIGYPVGNGMFLLMMYPLSPLAGCILTYSAYRYKLDSYVEVAVQAGSTRILVGLSLAISTWLLMPGDARWKRVTRARIGKAFEFFWAESLLPMTNAMLDLCQVATALLVAWAPGTTRLVANRIRGYWDPITKTAPYEYKPLRDGQIRVLKPKPCLPGLLEASLIISDPDSVEYEAISYRWGNPSPYKDILVDNARLAIPQSAFAALMTRASVFHERLIWIDSICINQSDEEEKGKQVSIMHSIYRKNSRVLLLPDGASWRSRLCVKLLYDYRKDLTAWAAVDQSAAFKGIIYRGWPTFGVSWGSLAQLLTREYWRRAWVVQEIVSGQKVELYLGGAYMPWEIFYEAVRNLQRHDKMMMLSNSRTPESEADQLRLISITMTNHLRQDSGPLPTFKSQEQLSGLECLLHLTTTFDASDERDKLWALYSLANDVVNSPDGPIRVDYSIDAQRTYLTVALWFFLHPRNPSISLLCYAGVGSAHTAVVQNYSWVPDLSYSSCRRFTDHLRQTPRFSASDGRGPTVTEVRLLNYNTLSIKGLVSDTVEHLIPVQEMLLLEHAQHRKTRKNEMEWLSSAFDLEERYRAALVAGSRLEQALIADQEPSITRGDLDDWFATAFGNPRGQNTMHASVHASASYKLLNQYLIQTCTGRRFGITRGGRLCLVPPRTREGDIVVILYGAQTPYILHRTEDQGVAFNLIVGEAYVQGIMNGEALTCDASDEFFDLF